MMQSPPKRKTWHPGDLVTVLDQTGTPIADGVVLDVNGLYCRVKIIELGRVCEPEIRIVCCHYLASRFCWKK